MNNKKKIILSIGILGSILLITGASYALWSLNINQNSTNNISSDCFKIEFMDRDAISLSNTFPIEDELGLEQSPYTFTIKNVCGKSAKYQINLETLMPSGTKMPDKYLKVNLSEENTSWITTKLDKTVNSNLKTDTTLNGAVDAYKLLTGIMEPGEIKEFNLRMWMHSDVTQYDEFSTNSSFKAKVSIIASYYEDKRGTIQAAVVDNNEIPYGNFYDYKDNIIKVIIEDSINYKETDLSWDVSENQDRSVMSYLVLNEDGTTYTLYIQGDGGVKANSNSSYLFGSFKKLVSIEGLKNLDTRYVTNMNNLFMYCESLVNVDLSNFDTRNVISMIGMFNCCKSLLELDLNNFNTTNLTKIAGMFNTCSSLKSLDLSSFSSAKLTMLHMLFYDCASLQSVKGIEHLNTSLVTNMNNMFYNCKSLTSVDVSNFDTSNVNNMQRMFYECRSLTNLDLSNFDTRNVTNMEGMFYGCQNLLELVLNNFDTSKVTNMMRMFYNCGSLTNLDISNFNTSNVTDMREMFYSCRSLTSLDLSNFDITKVIYLDNTFYDCTSLKNLNLGIFNTSNIMYFNRLFNNMPNDSVIYVNTESAQNWILNLDSTSRPESWTIDNVIIK